MLVPAIDPLISWSRYLDQLKDWFTANLDPGWVDDVKAMQELLHRGDAIYQMMQVTGEEGITPEDFIVWEKSVLLDMVFLQQDAFDDVDASMSLERQQKSFQLLKGLITAEYRFKDKDEARDYFTRIKGAYKNLNYSPDESADYDRYRQEIEDLAAKYMAVA